MTLPEAQAVLDHFGPMAYLNKFQVRVVAQAKAVVSKAAEQTMAVEMKGVCTRCYGDGFHRITNDLLSGPCQLCDGTGRMPSSRGARASD